MLGVFIYYLFKENTLWRNKMNEIINEVIVQWGLTGLFMLAAGYIIWDNYKSNKKAQKIMEERLSNAASNTDVHTTLTTIQNKIEMMDSNHQDFVKTITARLEDIETKIDKADEDEGKRLEAIMRISPAIYTLLRTHIEGCNADHIGVALLHNGTKSICGVPFLKFDIVAEKFFPVRNPQDAELAPLYKDEDIMLHNQLPAAVVQNPRVAFDLTAEKCPLEHIDTLLYRKMVARGIKHLIIESFTDMHNSPNGFVFAYSFKDSPLDEKEFEDLTKNIQDIYRNTVF